MSRGFWGAGRNVFLDLDWVYTGLALNYVKKQNNLFKNVNLLNKLSSINCVTFYNFVLNKVHVFFFNILYVIPKSQSVP